MTTARTAERSPSPPQRTSAEWEHSGDSAYGSDSPSRLSPAPRYAEGASLLRTQSHLQPASGEEGEHPALANVSQQLAKKRPAAWRDLPRKDQLTILTLIRLAEPITQTSLQAYMYFMLGSFDTSLSPEAIASQAGLLVGSFTAAQCLTAVWWGRLADKEWFGRKNVLLIGLVGTTVSTLGFGFSTNFWTAMLFRSLGGALNGNVGVMRTMISEIIKEKKYQAKAFLILPVTFNVGVMFGPLLGGWLQDPIGTYPNVFGPGSRIGGRGGVMWMQKYPYALPNIVTACFLFVSFFLAYLGLEETHVDRRNRRDYGIELNRTLRRILCLPFRKFRRNYSVDSPSHRYARISTADRDRPIELEQLARKPSRSPPRVRPKLAYRRIFTRNVCYTLLAHGMLHVHISTFNALWFLFLSTPRAELSTISLPFTFTGGLGLDPPTIGFAIGIIGALGLVFQFTLYPFATFRLGVVTCFRYALMCFPLVYALIPYLAVLPSSSAPPAAASGASVWIAIGALLLVQVVGRTFVVPITQILINNCTPHPSVLGAVHGVGQSVSSGCRTVGPVLWSWLYGVGLERTVVGMAWWLLAVEAVGAAAASWLLREGTGHEIWLEGDDEEEQERAGHRD